ncbi:MAG: beta strand repeat-containing protein [Burkholderiaceae bacterium]
MFNNTGTVNVNAGTMLMGGGGTSGGLFNIANGAKLEFRNGNHTLNNVTTSGAGTLQISTDNVGADAVVTINGGTLKSAFLLSGSTLTGTDHTFQGAATWTGGTITGAATASTTFGSTLAISGPGSKTLSGGRSVNAGDTTWSGNTGANNNGINISGASIFNSSGSFTDVNTFDSTINVGNGGGIFNNNGVFNKQSNTTTSIGTQFNSTGTVNVNAGTMLMQGGGTSSGLFNIANGAMLEFRNGNHTLNNVTTSGAGTLQISTENVGADAVVAINGGTHTTPFLLSGSILTGTDHTFQGVASWTGGTITGAATAHTNFGNTLAISGPGSKTLSGGRSVNAGDTTWSGNTGANNNGINISGASIFNSSGSFIDANTFDSAMNVGNGGGVFNNNSVFTKLSNTTTAISTQFSSSGTANVNAGTLLLHGGGTSSGVFNIANGAKLEFRNGNHTLNNVTTSGAGTLQISTENVGADAIVAINGGTHTTPLLLSGSTLTGTDHTFQGPATWTGGTISGAASTTFDNNVSITGPNLKTLLTRTLNLNGTTTWSGNTADNNNAIRFWNGATINNNSTFNDANQFASFIEHNVGGPHNFNNNGTYNKQANTVTTVDLGVVFNNSGTLNINAGTMRFSSGTKGPTGTVNVASGATFQQDAASTVGNLITAGTLVLGTQTLTVHLDYNNANFGVGNDFNRRANVNVTAGGPAQRLLAAGDANQGVTGVGISNGTTANPTLTIGNVHVGDTTYTYNITNTGTTGPALRGAIQTSVNGASLTDTRLSGSGVTAGNWGPLATGASLTRDVVLTVGAAGVFAPLSGQAVSIINNFENTRSQLLTISSAAGAAAYRLAAANTIGAIDFGAVHVGDVVARALTVTNTAANDGFSEKLNASFGSTSDVRITTSGSISLLGAGATNSTGMVVGLNTAAAGLVSGTATVLLASDGTGTSGLGVTALPSQNVGVAGVIAAASVFRLANPVINTVQPVDFGNLRIGASASRALSITNNVPNDGFSEKLNAAAGSTTAGVTASGSFNLLGAGANDTTSIVVGINTATAGNKSGTATIGFVSDGTGTSGLGQTTLASQNVSVNGSVFRVAQPTLNTSTVNLAARVGGSAAQAVGITNSAPADGFSEGLKASLGSAPAGFVTSGSIANLAAGASNNSALQIGLVTSAAGNFSGGVGVSFASTGASTSGLADLALAGQSVSVSGKVYTPAIGTVNTASVNFGIVHKGDVIGLQGVSVANGAAVTALNDTLHAGFGMVSSPFSGTGSVSGLAAGSTDTASLKVGLDTASAGVFTGTAAIDFASHDGDLADAALAPGSVFLSGTVNNFAEVALTKTGGAGTLAKTGNIYTLDFGSLALGDADLLGTLGILNSAFGPADLLGGSFDLGGVGPAFVLSGFTSFDGIVAGGALGGLSISLDSATPGRFEDTIVLHAFGSNASGFEGALADTTLVLRGDVFAAAVPEPGTYVLMVGGLTLLLVVRRRRLCERAAA